ncbi:MAG: hypothetical protein KDA89_24560, partial [Planctomycetaceae bacterium]|nr:hypothetical protein [Planctomycetaceae bacterium]
WRDRHRRTSAIRHLAEPEQPAVSDSAQSPPVSAAELWNQTRALLDAQGLDAAEHQLRRLLAVDPEHVGATFALGQLRLNQGHADGEDLLQHILSLQTPEWTQPAGNVLERHFTTTGQRDALKLLRQQLDDFERLRTDAEKERTDIRRSDAFVPHNLPQNDLSNLQTVLQNLEHCRAAWLVQKQLRHFPDERLYVLCVDTATRIGPAQRSERNDRLLTSVMMKAELPGRLFVVNPTGEFRAVARRLMKQDDWQIFERS